jgi:hypothetical protein
LDSEENEEDPREPWDYAVMRDIRARPEGPNNAAIEVDMIPNLHKVLDPGTSKEPGDAMLESGMTRDSSEERSTPELNYPTPRNNFVGNWDRYWRRSLGNDENVA